MLPCSAVCECEGDCAQLRGPAVATAALADTALQGGDQGPDSPSTGSNATLYAMLT